MEKKTKISIEQMDKKLPFAVPENYFQSFAEQMDEQVQFKFTLSLRVLRPWMYLAAMFVGLYFVGQLFYSSYQQDKMESEDNYELYVASQMDELELVDATIADEPTLDELK